MEKAHGRKDGQILLSDEEREAQICACVWKQQYASVTKAISFTLYTYGMGTVGSQGQSSDETAFITSGVCSTGLANVQDNLLFCFTLASSQCNRVAEMSP